MDERKLRDALKACLSEADFPPERQRAVLRAVRKDEPIVKRKISAALMFAIVMLLAVGGAAIAVGLGVFGQSANDQQNEQSATRLDHLEAASVTLGDTQAAQAPDAPETSTQPQTVYDEMIAKLYARRFNLTLNQSYCDGNKLYYAYTLTTNTPLFWYEGEGAPTGIDEWITQEEGKYVDHYTQSREEDQSRYTSFFAAHPVGYIGRETMGLGDGADLDGEPLIILDSGETVIDDYTIQGFQEVEMPEGFTPDGDIEIELTILYGVDLAYQDEKNVYMGRIVTPEDRGTLRLNFTVPLNGQADTYMGTVTTSAYSATATVTVSDVDISGEVVFDAPEWVAAFESTSAANINGDSSAAPAYIYDYNLIAGGEEYPNLDGAFGVNADGQFVVGIRYDLPADMSSMQLHPTTSGVPYTEETTQYENEEIVLMK